MHLIAQTDDSPSRLGGVAVVLLLLLSGLAAGCGRHQPTSQVFRPEEYTPVTIEQLQAPRKAGLFPGQMVSVEGYFWQYLEYDPFTVPKYLALARRPLAESRWRWASLYNSPQMQGYFDRLALTRELRHELDLKRLEHVRIYGRLAHLPFGILYLKAQHVERLEAEKGLLSREPAASNVEGQEPPIP
jgi:hypothetical protein